ncbi:hypothetical protein ACFV2H_11840 [Streptomyces sp. NPDC059629]|uniref:hypothetical protein n=1 Tax=Streptomyces sp. NPDC059629 TaxID=3346889 RepID=UPI0036972C44
MSTPRTSSPKTVRGVRLMWLRPAQSPGTVEDGVGVLHEEQAAVVHVWQYPGEVVRAVGAVLGGKDEQLAYRV